MQPNFLFVGPDKSGSSWLFRVLGAHPEVYLSPAKDIYFFDRYFDRGRTWYISRFSDANVGHKVVGEICHDYLYSPSAAQRIYDTLGPETNILICLREPADRAFSDYLNRIRSGGEGVESFGSAIANNPRIVESGKYSSWVENYTSIFGRDRVMIAVFDDLVADPQAFLSGITDWLNISRLRLTEEQRAPARPAAKSRSRGLTKLVRTVAQIARNVGLEGLVGKLKSSPRVESALYKEYVGRPEPEPETVAAIRSQVRADVLKLSQNTGIPFDVIWRYGS